MTRQPPTAGRFRGCDHGIPSIVPSSSAVRSAHSASFTRSSPKRLRVALAAGAIAFGWGHAMTGPGGTIGPSSAGAGENEGGAVGMAESGPLRLDDLIQLALANNPDLAELRGEIAVSKATERAAKDWRDPEIRFQWERDHDVELPPNETERIESTTTENISQTELDSVTQGDGDTRRTRTDSSIRREQTETTTRRIERGARSDRIIEETRESTRDYERSFERGTESRLGTSTPTSERLVRQSDERVVGRTVEDRFYDHNRLTPDEDFSIALRLYVPSPWEQKAKVEAAKAETHRLQALLRAAEHAVVLDVREAYAKLKEVDAERAETAALALLKRRFVDEQEELSARAKPEDLIDAQGEYFELEFEIDALELEFDQAAAELAGVVGLGDPGRISLDSSLVPRDIDVSGLEPAFLHQIAELYRSELLDLVHRAMVSKYELKEYNTQKIPWFSFIQGFYGVEYDAGYRASDNYGIQFSMTLPIFSWFKNKEDDVFREEIRSYNQQASVARFRIQSEVDAALSSFKKARARLAAFEKVYEQSRTLRLEKIAELDELGVRFKDARDVAEESLAEWRVRRVKVYALYNEAILSLERALGTDLTQVFSTTPAQLADESRLVDPALSGAGAATVGETGEAAGTDANLDVAADPPAPAPTTRASRWRPAGR